VADLPHQCLSAGLLVPMQDWVFLHRCLVSDSPKLSDSLGSRAILHRTLSIECSQSRSFHSLIKFILVLLANTFHNTHSLNYFELESAHSSSHGAASLGWEKGLVHYCTILLLGGTSASRGNSANSKLQSLEILRNIWPHGPIHTDTPYARNNNGSQVTCHVPLSRNFLCQLQVSYVIYKQRV
jgi:hypothetical protein